MRKGKDMHTKGPWGYDYTKNYGFEIMVDDGKIADVMTRGGGESLSNANLISSAPDLLEALKHAERQQRMEW
jgi:hypothetical protein